MAATLMIYFSVRLPLELYLRPHYQRPLLRTLSPASTGGRGGRTTDWVLSQGWIDSTGHKLSRSERGAILQQLRNGVTSVERYMVDHGLRQYVEYHPDTRFWHFQFVEALLLFTLSGVLVAASIWLIRRRTT